MVESCDISVTLGTQLEASTAFIVKTGREEHDFSSKCSCPEDFTGNNDWYVNAKKKITINTGDEVE